MSEEIFGAVFTTVKAVNMRLGAGRSADQYSDLVEGMYKVPVATHGEELLTAGSITHPGEYYGAFLATQMDLLCAIGYNTTSYSHRSRGSLRMQDIPPD